MTASNPILDKFHRLIDDLGPSVAMSEGPVDGGSHRSIGQLLSIDWTLDRSDLDALFRKILPGFGINDLYRGRTESGDTYQSTLLHDAIKFGNRSYVGYLAELGANTDPDFEIQFAATDAREAYATIIPTARMLAMRAQHDDVGPAIQSAALRRQTALLLDSV